MGYVLGKTSLSNLVGIHPRLVEVVKAAIKISSQDFSVGDSLRTAAEQNALYKRGVSQKDGYKNKSNHQPHGDGLGYAVDLVPYVAGRGMVWDWDLIYPVAAAIAVAGKDLRVKIRWGGSWNTFITDVVNPTPQQMKNVVEAYKVSHPGPDFIDGPHYELVL